MEGIWQNWAESPPLLGFAGGLQGSRVSKPGRDQCIQMQANNMYIWTEKLCLWFLTSLISVLHFKLKLIPWGFSSGYSLHASFLKVRSWKRSLPIWVAIFHWCPCLLQLWEGYLVSTYSPLSPLLLLWIPRVLHACHCCNSSWSRYRIWHLFTQAHGLKPQTPLCRTRYWGEGNCLSGITNAG